MGDVLVSSAGGIPMFVRRTCAEGPEHIVSIEGIHRRPNGRFLAKGQGPFCDVEGEGLSREGALWALLIASEQAEQDWISGNA